MLEGPRGQQMGKLLGVDVTKEPAGCLNCHAMVNLKAANGLGITIPASFLDRTDQVIE